MSPFYMTKRLRDPVHRYVIIAGYSCTIWIIGVTSALTYVRLQPPPTNRETIIALENASIIVSVFACNLPVMLGYIHRRVLERHLNPSSSSITPATLHGITPDKRELLLLFFTFLDLRFIPMNSTTSDAPNVSRPEQHMATATRYPSVDELVDILRNNPFLI
ncbi:hypothetical protein GALMADRAFT_214201 [Galerina marginata CBS 339.88]|uniref:Uncharacterized protein n=1 Tax=Galerina marginata (strain CBS 339.88) TaxID=685588 RepID=A0A067SL99_GALM3|nr:hypothetical protein GALMADRAFT_214201 [Galerina marginata CBS 339.88]